jgi:hypothetical protein
MPDTGLANSPNLVKGAIVQLIEDIIGVLPNVIPFQYNPTKLSQTITPWNPFEVDQTQRGAQAPNVQPFEPKQSFTLELELDAADDLEDGNPVASVFGVADRMAALDTSSSSRRKDCSVTWSATSGPRGRRQRAGDPADGAGGFFRLGTGSHSPGARDQFFRGGDAFLAHALSLAGHCLAWSRGAHAGRFQKPKRHQQ